MLERNLHPGEGLAEDGHGDVAWLHASTLSELPGSVAGAIERASNGGTVESAVITFEVQIGEQGAGLRRLAIVVQDRRLWTAWLEPHNLLGTLDPPDDEETLDLIRGVSRIAAQRPEVTTSEDLGLLVMYQLALSYTHARRSLFGRVEAIEDGLYEDLAAHGHPDVDVEQDLLDMRHAISEIRAALEDLNRPGMKRDAHLIWTGPSASPALAEEVDELIDRALRDLRNIADRQRQLTLFWLNRRQAIAQERFQRLAGFVSFGIIAPGLVATIYGASIFTDKDNRATGVTIMLVAMMITGIGSALAAHRWAGRGARHKRRLRSSHASDADDSSSRRRI